MASNPLKKICEKCSKKGQSQTLMLFLPPLMTCYTVISQIIFANKSSKQSHFPLSSFFFSHKISLRSSWLDIREFFACACVCLWTDTKSRSIKAPKKNNKLISSYLNGSSLVDKGIISWKKNQSGITKQARQCKIVQSNSIGFGLSCSLMELAI